MPGSIIFEPAAFCQTGEQTLKHRSHGLCHPEGPGRKSSVRSGDRRHFPQTMREECCRELISGGHGLLKLGPAPRGNDLIERILRYEPQAIQSKRFLGRRAPRWSRSLPCEMVKNIAICACRTRSPRPGNADGAEAIDQDTRFSCPVVHLKSTFDALVVALLYRGLNEAGGSW